MSQGQSKEGEHLINTHGSRQSSVHPHRAMMPVRFLLCHAFFPPPSGSESSPFEISGALSVDFKEHCIEHCGGSASQEVLI